MAILIESSRWNLFEVYPKVIRFILDQIKLLTTDLRSYNFIKNGPYDIHFLVIIKDYSSFQIVFF